MSRRVTAEIEVLLNDTPPLCSPERRRVVSGAWASLQLALLVNDARLLSNPVCTSVAVRVDQPACSLSFS
jgi:hypothetical protein